MRIEEARDPRTSLVRLTEILDVCDQPRRNYAADRKREALEAALARGEFRDLAMAVASNPNLYRDQWVRALELAPQAAVRNPLMQLMIVGGTPIIQHDYEVVALGVLAACAMHTPPCSIEREALVDLICMGLEPIYA